MKPNKNLPHPVDIYAGQMLRELRNNNGMNQMELGKAISKIVTFQQIQKYERGTNRMSASKLYEFAHALNVPVSVFFPSQGNEHIPTYSKQEIRVLEALRSIPEELHESISKLILYVGENGL